MANAARNNPTITILVTAVENGVVSYRLSGCHGCGLFTYSPITTRDEITCRGLGVGKRYTVYQAVSSSGTHWTSAKEFAALPPSTKQDPIIARVSKAKAEPKVRADLLELLEFGDVMPEEYDGTEMEAFWKLEQNRKNRTVTSS